MPEAKINPDKFIKFSSALTGVDSSQLSPGVDPVGLAQQYREILQDRLDQQQLADLNAMLDKFPTNTVDQLLTDPKFGPLARCILKLWLLGAWYDPKTPRTLDKVVSSQA
jgi:hypothetical protein